MSLQVSNASLTPGASGSYDQAPFWSDTFVLLIHPQLGFWSLSGEPVISLLAAAGSPGAPDIIAPTVADLDQCAKQKGVYANGIPVAGTSEVLNKDECLELLKLDPFYGVGQSLPSLSNSPRARHVGGIGYGVDPVSMVDFSPTLGQMISYSGNITVSSVGSYNATVTDVLSSSSSLTLGLGLFGIGGSDKIESSETTTHSTDWTVTLQTSFTATAQSSTNISGALDDHHGVRGDGNFLGYQPHVEIYQDNVFGSFMFQDPSAPAAP
jgi:hypothetical protein